MEKMEANLSLSTKSLVQQPLKVLTSSYSAFHLKKTWRDFTNECHASFLSMQMRSFQICSHWYVQFLMVSMSAYLRMAKQDLGRLIQW